MSEEIKNTNTNEQPDNSTPEDKGGKGGEKLFTQEDVNRIVADRLAKERAKGQPSAADQREQELAQRELALECRDYLERHEKAIYDAKCAVELVHVLTHGAQSLSGFKDQLHAFYRVLDALPNSTPTYTPPKPQPTLDSNLRFAFGLNNRKD